MVACSGVDSKWGRESSGDVAIWSLDCNLLLSLGGDFAAVGVDQNVLARSGKSSIKVGLAVANSERLCLGTIGLDHILPGEVFVCHIGS